MVQRLLHVMAYIFFKKYGDASTFLLQLCGKCHALVDRIYAALDGEHHKDQPIFPRGKDPPFSRAPSEKNAVITASSNSRVSPPC